MKDLCEDSIWLQFVMIEMECVLGLHDVDWWWATLSLLSVAVQCRCLVCILLLLPSLCLVMAVVVWYVGVLLYFSCFV